MIDDVHENKAAIIRRCLHRIDQEYQGNPARLNDYTTEDSVVLNLLRACEAAIDLAMHHVSLHHLGVPQTSRQAFELLAENRLISRSTAGTMRRMVGFRNVAVHAYQQIQRPILLAILERHLAEFIDLIAQLETGGHSPESTGLSA